MEPFETDLILAENIAIADLMDQRIGNLTSSAGDDDTNWIFNGLNTHSTSSRRNLFKRVLITDEDMMRVCSKGSSR